MENSNPPNQEVVGDQFMVDARVINPLYSGAEIRRVFNRAQDATSAMEWKDDVWRESVRQEFVAALQARVAARDGDVPGPGGDAA